MINVTRLTKRFGSFQAIGDLEFHVAPGEVLGFLGPNGAGKTTTLRILAGFLPSTQGSVTVDGIDVRENPNAAQAVIGYLPENVPLYPDMRVQEYLSYRAALKGVPSKTLKSAVDRALDACAIGNVRHRIIGQLSKGYRQRIGIADALVADPKILILDEPTIGLDPSQIRQVRELICSLGGERTVILSSHILPEVEAVCSRVLIINKGSIVGQGQPDELRERIFGAHTSIEVVVIDPENRAEQIFGSINGVQQLSRLEAPESAAGVRYKIGTGPDQDLREAIFDAAVSGGIKLLQLQASTASLEEVFIHITTGEAELDTQPDPSTAEASPEPEEGS